MRCKTGRRMRRRSYLRYAYCPSSQSRKCQALNQVFRACKLQSRRPIRRRHIAAISNSFPCANVVEILKVLPPKKVPCRSKPQAFAGSRSEFLVALGEKRPARICCPLQRRSSRPEAEVFITLYDARGQAGIEMQVLWNRVERGVVSRLICTLMSRRAAMGEPSEWIARLQLQLTHGMSTKSLMMAWYRNRVGVIEEDRSCRHSELAFI